MPIEFKYQKIPNNSMTQINLRLPNELRKEAERYMHSRGYRNIQELATDAIRMKVFEGESIKETLEIIKNKELMSNIRRSREDVKKGRLVSWDSLQKKWKKEHAKI